MNPTVATEPPAESLPMPAPTGMAPHAAGSVTAPAPPTVSGPTTPVAAPPEPVRDPADPSWAVAPGSSADSPPDAGPADTPPVPVATKSVYTECIEEENRHKWIESEKAGYDLGEACIRQWVRKHWQGYLRARWVEHLQGKCFWVELDRGDFGLLQREFKDQRELLDAILDQLKSGKENLHVILWAIRSRIPTEPVHRILQALDVNSRRLVHRFEET